MARRVDVHKLTEESYNKVVGGSTYKHTSHHDLCPICAAEFDEFMKECKGLQ